ncbi:hypothetical protein PMAYCL1PPCAC_13104, partial [Pristionchus mayeri]
QLKHKAMNKLSDLILSEHLHTLVALTRVSIGAISHRIETESVRDLDATAEFATVSQWTETTRAAIVHALSIYATVGEWTLPDARKTIQKTTLPVATRVIGRTTGRYAFHSAALSDRAMFNIIGQEGPHIGTFELEQFTLLSQCNHFRFSR